ncbi:DUF3465 domain-containing protein [Shewanella sp. SG41-4]|uniref:DUF3465 domain-containing protein n=1 Tax=Shewanella sp. SG41-4 TaxID=2760976 RepID=UPI0016002FA1|nr:DUF3465 domain-containing protein [Shewanella sp. SG41-4]MBB1437842.1 DUF3465 domain-containing protein [Shewanella sp. SG41-4]
MKKWIALLVIIILSYQWFGSPQYSVAESLTDTSTTALKSNTSVQHSVAQNNNALIQQAFEHQQENVQVQGLGTVIKLLPDDNKGSRHQRLIVKISSSFTVLVAHNIDLAPRVEAISVGDEIEFYGVYEWNNKGGVVHWTHHDPNGRHLNGWLLHQGKTYQ